MKIILLLALVGFVASSPFSRNVIKQFPERIVGGSQATRGEFPWIVQIKRGSHYCGGSIVNANWIVTAAHCSVASISGYTVVASMKGVNKVVQFQLLLDIHPIIPNDIAVWRVSSPFTFNTYVAAASLASSNPSGNVVVAGWGTLSSGGSLPTILMKVTVPMVSDSSCKSSYGSSAILAGMICAGTGGKDSCQGDSGGPLMSGNTLSGVVSWGNGCALPNYPGVYTSVAYFNSWIRSNTA